MTLTSVKEYAAAIRERYQKADKEENGRMLDEFVKVTGYHRKAATRLLCKTSRLAQVHIGRPNKIKNMGISKFDVIIGTHPHEDHIGGLDAVINNFEIGFSHSVYRPLSMF